MRPRKIHVDPGEEYNGETYIWCECVTPEGEEPVGCYGHPPWQPDLFDGLFTGGSPEDLRTWMKEHS